jgi:ubiquinone/menaquinone biosynthesis C-methylase UbiE
VERPPSTKPGQHGWQVQSTSAELYEQLLVPTVTLPWARDLVERVGLRRGGRVLDVACGTGVVARLAALEVGDGGRVVALDVNREMLAVGRALPPPAGAPIAWCEGSADALPLADGEFEAVLCQLGLQFFPDRLAALQEMRRVLAAAGRIGASVFTSILRNPAARALADAVDRHVGSGASHAKRSEHSLSDDQELRELFEAAGFVGIEIETVTKNMRFSSIDEWVRIQFTATPLASLLAECDLPQREHMVTLVGVDVSEALGAFERGGAFAFPQEVHVALATA